MVIVGCSSGARSGGSASPAGSAAPAETESAGSAASPGAPSAAADVTAFITPEVTAVLRSRGEHFLTITHAAKVAESLPGSKPPCWTKLVQATGMKIE